VSSFFPMRAAIIQSWMLIPRIGYPLHSSAAEPGLVQAPDILAACSIAAEPLVNLLERPGVIASRNKIFCVFHPAKAITQTNWSEGDTLYRIFRPRRVGRCFSSPFLAVLSQDGSPLAKAKPSRRS